VVHRTHVESLAAQAVLPELQHAMQDLTRSSQALQHMVMQVRMIPVEAVFLRFPRLVRDLSSKLGKQVELQLEGQDTELDRTVVELLFAPGFSTAEQTSDISGLGVGMDAVRTSIRGIGGEVVLSSEQGAGTTAQIRLPLTLAIMAALLVEARGMPFAVPLDRVERTLKLADHTVRSVAGRRMLVLRDGVLPLLDAAEALSSLLGRPIDVSVPNALALPLADAVDAAGPADAEVTAVVLPIFGDLDAVVLMLFHPQDAAQICGLLGVEADTEVGVSAL